MRLKCLQYETDPEDDFQITLKFYAGHSCHHMDLLCSYNVTWLEQEELTSYMLPKTSALFLKLEIHFQPDE